MPAAPRPAHPWTLVLCGGLVMGLALGVRHVQGLFLLPVTLAHGWPRETFATAMALQNLVWGLTQPLLGMVADRYGSTRIIVPGLVAGALGLGLMATANSPGLFMFAAGGLMGLGLSGTAFGAVYGAISRRVPAQGRGWALGMAGAIGGLGQFVLVPLAHGLIAAVGWQGALGLLALALGLLVPLARQLRDHPVGWPAGAMRPAGAGAVGATTAPHQGLREAMAEAFSHRGFWLLNAGFFACGFQLAFIANHLPAYLLDQGLQPVHAVAALALIALVNVGGTFGCGVLGERLPRKYLLAWLYLLRSAAMALFVLLPLSPATVYAFAAVMGLLWLGTVPLTSGLMSQVFGVQYAGTLFGFVFLGHQLGSFLGVWLGGRVFQATGSYELVWLVAMGVGVLAAALHAPIDDSTLRRPAAAGGVA